LRAGLTLIEILVVVAIMGVMILVGTPVFRWMLALEQQAAINDLRQAYTWLLDEATLRNVTFRVAYNLDQNTWKVELGAPNTVVFGTPEEREEYEEELEDKKDEYTGSGRDEEGVGDSSRFAGLDDPAFKTEQSFPDGIRIEFVYTPQYGEDGVRPSEETPEDSEEEAIAYTYIFPDGTAEHTVVRIVDIDNPEEGYTLEVEPISGKVRITENEITDPSESLAWLPEDGPEIP